MPYLNASGRGRSRSPSLPRAFAAGFVTETSGAVVPAGCPPPGPPEEPVRAAPRTDASGHGGPGAPGGPYRSRGCSPTRPARCRRAAGCAPAPRSPCGSSPAPPPAPWCREAARGVRTWRRPQPECSGTRPRPLRTRPSRPSANRSQRRGQLSPGTWQRAANGTRGGAARSRAGS